VRFQQVVDQLVEIEAVEETIAAEAQRVIRALHLGEVLEIPLPRQAMVSRVKGCSSPFRGSVARGNREPPG
jgi:hypothetical protein